MIRRMLGCARRRLKPHYMRVRQWTNGGVYAVDIRGMYGFFAHLPGCLWICAYCERHHLRPYLVLSSPYYVDSERGGNWLDYFFESPQLLPQDRDRIAAGRVAINRVAIWTELGLPDWVRHQSLEKTHDLAVKYMPVRPEFESYVDSFVHDHFGGQPVLGVHYRGTDKTSEAPPVSRDRIRKVISAYLQDHPEIASLYVASDEESFIEWSLRTFDSLHVIVHPDHYRSTDSQSVHETRGGDSFLKGRDALVNALLLSRCAALIRTASRLSAWSSVFNPRLPVVMLNRPYEGKVWFPETEILKRAMDHYLPPVCEG